MRGIVSLLGLQSLIAPAALAADNTPVAIDLATYEAAGILLHIGIGGITFSGTNKIEFVLRHGDTDAVNDHTAIAQDDVRGVTVSGSGIIRSLVAAHAAPSITKLDYVGGKRYISLLADFSGTHGTATPLSATALLGFPLTGPVA